mmetsp:Transcript_48096/g.94971  ORF Transcript_48096/g.94971 Transcript_48096/m.94971 type:complete len:136 (-) Transcript_48096:53-460(-)
MLYIDTKVNGVPFKAFVDTGAQMTIISRAAAKRAGLESLIDERFQGRAVGVGEAPIVGRIHMTEMEVGDSTLLCSFTVLGGESDIDIILGLDMLMKHECSVNLKDKVLEVANTVVPFLPEKDLPMRAHGVYDGRV